MSSVLVLAAGIPAEWLSAGVTVTRLPTQFGLISYDSKEQDGKITLSIKGDVNPPDGFRIRLPNSLTAENTVTLNGGVVSPKAGDIAICALPATIVIDP